MSAPSRLSHSNGSSESGFALVDLPPTQAFQPPTGRPPLPPPPSGHAPIHGRAGPNRQGNGSANGRSNGPANGSSNRTANGSAHRTANSTPNGSAQPQTQAAPKPKDSDPPENKPKKPSKLAAYWKKTGLDLGTILTMLKAGLPPTIAIAAFQSDAFAKQYNSLGYLVAILSLVTISIMPRAKFLQTLFLNVVALCLATGVAALCIWSGIRAREHTTPKGQPLEGYNAAACAVNGVWLFFQSYVVNSIRAAKPQFLFPCIIYSIMMIVSTTYGPYFTTTAQMRGFVTRLCVAFLTGFAFSFGVSLFILPTTTRTIVFKKQTGVLMMLKGVLRAQASFFNILETRDPFVAQPEAPSSKPQAGSAKKKSQKPQSPLGPEATAYKGALGGVLGLLGGIQLDIPFAKREIAFGKLNGTDIGTMHKLLQKICIPLSSMSSIIDIFERVKKAQGWDQIQDVNNLDDPRVFEEQQAVRELQSIMQMMHEPFCKITDIMDQGIMHVLLRLDLIPAPKKKKGDVEKNAGQVKPGDENFTAYIDEQCKRFWNNRGLKLQTWCEANNVDLSIGAIEENLNRMSMAADAGLAWQQPKDQRQVFIILYMEYLLWQTAHSIYQLAQFADSKHADGTMRRHRLVYPNLKRFKKWIAAIFGSGEDESDDVARIVSAEAPTEEVLFGDSFKLRRDPEHLPPANWFERLGDVLRILPALMRSKASEFGFRAAVATISIALIAYLKGTYEFYIRQRILWALLMISFSMSPNAGEATFTFTMRVLGTIAAMVASFVIYYIVDGKTPGMIVFLYLWICCCFYIILKHPRFVVVGILSSITAVLIIDYELEVRKIGQEIAGSNGQPYYPIYLLAPYRLAAVVGGLCVAYFWTIFPYPMSQHSQLRKDLGVTIGMLSLYTTITHETISSRIRGDGGNPLVKGTPAFALEKARMGVFSKTFGLIMMMKRSSSFVRWQVRIGGRFPKEKYDVLIDRVERILRWTSLASFASATLSEGSGLPAASDTDTPEEARQRRRQTIWLNDFRELLRTTKPATHEVTAVLAQISSAVLNGIPLPPYLKTPQPYTLIHRLERMDPGILSAPHVAEPGYAAFAVMTIASRSLLAELEGLIAEVKELVGELNYSYSIVHTAGAPPLASAGSEGAGGLARGTRRPVKDD